MTMMTTQLTDFSNLSTTELQRQFNLLVGNNTWLDAKQWRPVKKFPNHDAAVRRCSKLEAVIKEHSAKMETQTTNATVNGNKPAPDPNRPPTLHQLTEQYNEMVEGAQKARLSLPAWAKVHTSDFASRDGAGKQLDRLKAAIEEAKKPKS
jgi:hypothetical protein